MNDDGRSPEPETPGSKPEENPFWKWVDRVKQIALAVIGVLTVIALLGGAVGWAVTLFVQDDLDEMENSLDAKIEETQRSLNANVDEVQDTLDQELDRIDVRLDDIRERLVRFDIIFQERIASRDDTSDLPAN